MSLAQKYPRVTIVFKSYSEWRDVAMKFGFTPPETQCLWGVPSVVLASNSAEAKWYAEEGQGYIFTTYSELSYIVNVPTL